MTINKMYPAHREYTAIRRGRFIAPTAALSAPSQSSPTTRRGRFIAPTAALSALHGCTTIAPLHQNGDR
jgi:hypothetical protein